MQFRNSIFVAAVTAAAAGSIPASAATIATAMTPLNIRSGPGPEYSVIGAIPDRGQATIIGCIQGSLWCQVSYGPARVGIPTVSDGDFIGPFVDRRRAPEPYPGSDLPSAGRDRRQRASASRSRDHRDAGRAPGRGSTDCYHPAPDRGQLCGQSSGRAGLSEWRDRRRRRIARECRAHAGAR